MSAEDTPPEPYRVIYSSRVRERLLGLSIVARERGDADGFVTALRAFDRRLRVYPQFGDPLTDLRPQSGQIRIGIIRPLVMRYTVFDERRQVFVTAIPVLLPRA